MRQNPRLSSSIALLVLAVLCSAQSAFCAGQATVVWLSIDGLRHDYIERAKPVNLSRLIREGSFTNREMPIFPSLTFPNHIAQVTGTTVDHHGIPMNGFFDSATNQLYSFPDEGTLLRAEPIWITAKRQGIRVAAIDWPMSHAQTGPLKSDYFNQTYDSQQTDEHRLNHVIEILNQDAVLQKTNSQPPIRLVLTYIHNIDTAGHRFGPVGPDIDKAIVDEDALIGPFQNSIVQWFKASHDPDDQLYFIVTTDHGMELIHTQVNLDRLIGADLAKDLRIVTSGPIATIGLDKLPAAERPQRARQILETLGKSSFLSAWPSDKVPAGAHFADPSRIGDIVVMLSVGYTYTAQLFAATQPAIPGLLGMHGYDPATSPNLQGTAIIWRYQHPMSGVDLGPVDNTQWHATVAKLLGIEPSKDANSRGIDLPG